MNALRLSVGMPNFNHARFLPAALDALLGQSYRPHEFIVIDDGSSDGSVAILRDYALRHPWMRVLVRERNWGVNATLSELLSVSTGDFFFAPAADDLVYDGFLEKAMKLLERHPSAGLCSAQIDFVDEVTGGRGVLDDNPMGRRSGGYYISPRDAERCYFRGGFWVHGNTAIFRREALLAIGGYRGELGFYQDGFAHFVLALAHGACFLPERLACERRSGSTISGSAARNPSELRRIRDLALGYMAGEFAVHHSPRLVRLWQARWDYARLSLMLDLRLDEWTRCLRFLCDSRSISYSGMRAGFRIGIRGCHLLCRLAAVILLTPGDMVMVGRKALRRLCRKSL